MRLVILCCSSVAFSALSATAQDSRSIAAVNAPLAYIAGVLGGADIKVIYPVPEGADPAYWEPSAEAIQTYQGADLILLNGAGYAGWVEKAVLPRSRIVDTTAGVEDRLIVVEEEGIVHKHGPEGEHVHGGALAITTWLDPGIALAQMEATAGAIARRWPELSDAVAERSEELRSEISAMGEAFSSLSGRLAGQQVFASHPVYDYFERAFLDGLISLHWEPDSTPPEEEWSSFVQMIDPDLAPVMIWEGIPTQETSERLRGLGVGIVVLDPMGNAPDRDRLFYHIGAQVAQ